MVFHVFEAQEEIRGRKWLHVVDAENEQHAIEQVRSQDCASEPIDCGELGEPDYGDSGFVVRPNADDDGVWEKAVSDLVTRKQHDSSVHYMQRALAHILVLVRQGVDDRDLEAIEAHCCHALGRASGVPADKVGTPDLAQFETEVPQ